MCVDPVSLLTLAGGLVSGAGNAFSAFQSAASYDAQSQLHARQAQMERDKGAYEGARKTDEARQILGQQVANYAASGIQIDGSAADVLAETGTQAQMDVDAIRYGANIRASNEQYNAAMARTNAGSARIGAGFGFLSPVIDAATQMKRPY